MSKVIVHNRFQIHYPYDIMLVKTATKIRLNKRAKPVKLAVSTPKAGTEAHITGFGLIVRI